ncbi:MAG: sulfatase-like hydrolase/transferase [Terriglobales bacterium]|jgi:arylsulfatase A-like enzyme/thioredoxin-like negative regulator of GroEL
MRVLRLLGILLLASSGWSVTQQARLAHTTNDAPAPAKRTQKPDVILITVDTTRADRMGFLGSNRGLTPNLDAVARDGTAFTRAYAHVPLTTASHATILTGTYPQYNHVNDFGVPLAAGLPYLPDILHQHGYRTAAFVGSLILDPVAGTAPGFDRGFDLYDAGFRIKTAKDNRYETVERRAGEVVARALAWLKTRPAGAPPFFLWVHLYDPHDPYDPPEPYKAKFPDPYDGEIAYADAMLGKLFTALKAAGVYQDALIAMMADHGEAFGEHGERTHGIFLYDETIHVPLLIKLPGPAAAGKRRVSVNARVGLVDVTPTVLEVAGIAIPKEIQGQPLVGEMQLGTRHSERAVDDHGVDRPIDRPIYSETDYPHRAFKWSSLRALRSGKYLAIDAPKRELYDQANDPKGLSNIADSSPAVTDTLMAGVEQFRQQTGAELAAAAKLGPEQTEKLRALGYVGGDSGQGHEGRIGGIDPKDRIEIANLMHDGILEVEQGEYQVAIGKLERVLQSEPDSAIAYLQLGTAWTRLKDYEKALPILQKAVELKTDSGLAQYELGLALFETGSWKESAPQFEQVVARSPRWADAHFSLAAVYARIDRVPDALQELDQCLALNPNHYRANLLRGRLLSLLGKAEEGLPNLRKAAAVEPDSREAHLFLADAYAQLGRPGDEKIERARAEKAQAPPVR